ncbi:MAG TPA: SMP-30/gluconolactonase/LRE family protein [Roseiflexaceae bacterium]|nr:SMP-30/gluconolactonase/LRE family protein [Roseiflexaceae bacterium]HMP39272.1 SMP-30/gluconolactonase/LRE family protein [Roseiflexaceae bacterium]
MTDSVELVIDAGATLAEGPVWDIAAQRLYWVDILEHRVHTFDPQHGTQQVFDIGQYVGAAVPRRSGGLILAIQHGFAHLDLASGTITQLVDVEADLPDNRFNDGKCDPAGRFWAGTMSLSGRQGAGSLYRFDPDQTVHRMVSDVSISNGLAWKSDLTTMYYIDTPTLTVTALDYDHARGAVANRRVVITIPDGQGGPDGMTIDAEGMLWVAHWGGSCVTRWDPAQGRLLQQFDIPAAQVTSCCFGGPGLDELYITTASYGLSAEARAAQPAAGGIFRVRPGVQGLPADSYAG